METLTLSNVHDKKNCHYIIVPNVENEEKVSKKDGKPFYLRIFASEHVDLVQLPETIEKTFPGEWTKAAAGGKRIEGAVENQFWCRNPQFFLNVTKPTHLKIILKKKLPKKTKQYTCGITITKAYGPTTPPASSIKGKEKARGVTLPSTLPGRGISYAQTLRNMKKDKGDLEKIPEFEPPNLNGPCYRKLQIFPREFGEESSYSKAKTDSAALYCFLQPTQGPFIIVPSLEKVDIESEFELKSKCNNLIAFSLQQR
jgi:calpain, invertebrate